jgi:Colicin V production protein.
MRFVIEILLLFVILLCIWNGYKKGFVMCIGGILAIIVSLYVGDLLADTFTSAVTPAVHPFVSGYMDGTEGKINATLSDLLGSGSQLSIEDAIKANPDIKTELCEKSFEKVGIYSSTAKVMAKDAISYETETGSTLSEAIIDETCNYFTYFIIFLIFFAITLIILTVLGNILNLSFKIPEMDKLNDIGGIASGAVTGLMFCAIIVWALKFSGLLFPEAQMKHTLITALFLKMNLLSHCLSI